MIPRLSRAALVLAALPLLFASCDSLSETANLFNVKFSSAADPYTGPTITGPDVSTATVSLASYKLQGMTSSAAAKKVLGQYNLTFYFHVVGDNRENSGKASFGTDLQPQLNFYINSKGNAPITATIDPFEIDSGAVKNLDFPVSVPLTTIDGQVLDQILNGDPIEYFLTGTLNFHLMKGVTIQGNGIAEVDLATGKVATRPSSGLVTFLLGLF